MIKGFKWKQQDAAFVTGRSEHMVRSCQASQGSQVSQKIWDYIFHTGGGGEGVCVWGGGCQPFHFWISLEIAACLLVASLAPCRPRARLVTGLVV